MSKKFLRRSSIAAILGQKDNSSNENGKVGNKRRESIKLFGRVSNSTESSDDTSQEKVACKVMVLGGKGTGKTSIISQFLYDQFAKNYKETIEEMYRGDFEIDGTQVSLNIQDTGGTYVYDFPSMVGVSLYSTDAVLLVFSVDSLESFEEVTRLRDLVMSTKGPDTPIVIVGNKTDLNRVVAKEETEATVVFDWENGYAECSAKDNTNIQSVFREILCQTKTNGISLNPSIDSRLVSLGTNSGSSSGQNTPLHMRRRQSLPQVPAFSVKRRLKLEISAPANNPNHLRNNKDRK